MQTPASNASILLTFAWLAACSGSTQPTAFSDRTSTSRSTPSPAPAATPGQAAHAPAPATADGARIFDNTCVACHQQNGAGIPGAYPSLAGSPVVLGDPRVLARWVILGERPASVPAGRYAAQMPRFGWLRPADAAALFTFLRSSFGNSASPVDAAAVDAAIAP